MKPLVKKIITHSKKEDKSGKFLKNGLVEILLVKIGILLALAIYGFYLDYVEQKKVKAYFVSIHQEIEPAIKNGVIKTKQIDTLILKTTNCLQILNSKNKDSLIYLQHNLEPLVRVSNQIFSFPAVNELFNSDYISKVKNKETVGLLRQMQQQLITIKDIHKYHENKHLLTIQPFMNEFFNYSEIALPKHKAQLIEGGPPTEYSKLYNNMVLWNLLSQKLEGYKAQIIRQENFGELLIKLNESIKKQIDK